MQCVRCRQEAAGEVHAPGAGAAARRPEPGERAGAGGQPPSPAGMELSTWSSGIKLSLGLLLCGALLPPEVPGKEGKRGTALVPPPGGLGLGRAGRGGPLWGAGSRSWPTAWGRRDNTDRPGGSWSVWGGQVGACGGDKGQLQTPSDSWWLSSLAHQVCSPPSSPPPPS